MASKIIWRPQIWHTHLYSECLDLYWFSSWLADFWPSGGRKHSEGGVSRAPSQQKIIWCFFSTCFEISIWNLVYTSSRQCHTSSLSFITVGSPWPTLQPRMGQCNFSSFMASKSYGVFRFGTLWPISCSYPRHSQLTRHSLMLANGRIRQSLTALVLTHWGLVMPFGTINLGQYWLR